MKLKHSLIAAAVCIALLLCMAGCSADDAPDTSAPDITPTAAPTAPTVPVDYGALYAAAVNHVRNASDLVLSYTYSLSRDVGGETYTEIRTGTASYIGLHTDDVEALVQEEVTYGGYTTQYIESYLGGNAYARVNNCSFRSDITADTFLAQQIPGVLLDETLYSDISAGGQATTLSFSNASDAEGWLQLDDNAQLTAASGSATLDEAGNLTDTSYHAQYAVGTVSYTLDMSVSIQRTTADLSTLQPVYGESCPVISDLQIPRYMLRTVGNVYASEAMSVNYCDMLYLGVYSTYRSQNSSFNTYGNDDDFMASMSTQVTVTDFVGVSSTNSQTILFRDRQYSEQVNGGTPCVDDTVTAQQVRISCEDSILSSLIPLEAISGAEVIDAGDYLCITFQVNDEFVSTICSWISRLYQISLDSWADSHSTEAAGGYLTINKYTGLPTAMGMNLSRSYVKDNVVYPMTYQLDQALELSSPNAYENITGLPLDESSSESASPLFYKVTGTDGQTLWLLGTIHIGDGRTANLPQQILDAFAGSDALAVEFDIHSFEEAVASDSALQQQIANAYYDVSAPLADQMPEELYCQFYPMMLATGSNSVNSPYLKVSVWTNLIENLYLRQSYGLRADQGMDQRLLTWATQQDMPIYEIESGLSQIQMLTGFSQKLQYMLLEDTLQSGMIAYYEQALQLYELWCQGDEAALTQALTDDTSAMTEEELKLYNEYYKAMYTDRNKAMLKAATGYLESGETVFYAVGLAHLLGEDGLLQALRDAGYTVELVVYN